MPSATPNALATFVDAAFQAAGASAAEASTIARHMVGANLAGHDSHGVQLLPGYVANVKRGDTVPGAPIEILDETWSALTKVATEHNLTQLLQQNTIAPNAGTR